MRSSRILMQAAKKNGFLADVPLEMAPLFAVVSVALGSACFFTYRHLTRDQELRLWKNPDLSTLDNVLDEEIKKRK